MKFIVRIPNLILHELLDECCHWGERLYFYFFNIIHSIVQAAVSRGAEGILGLGEWWRLGSGSWGSW
jgi:hypothetical protein